ncbi:MAG: hypothetical protein WC783_04330 [Candidatus Paceibacterota bacterium]|jgi:hypothetical protein
MDKCKECASYGDDLLEILQSAQSTIMQFADILSNHPENEDMLCSEDYTSDMERLDNMIESLRKCIGDKNGK